MPCRDSALKKKQNIPANEPISVKTDCCHFSQIELANSHFRSRKNITLDGRIILGALCGLAQHKVSHTALDVKKSSDICKHSFYFSQTRTTPLFTASSLYTYVQV